MEKLTDERKHFVLIHGVCHGAWCWYKVKAKLKLAGHLVTALDMAASGIDTKSIQDVRTITEYSQPLLEFMEKLPPAEKVVLVGHSLGGINISLAMEKFPEKISLAVFVTALMPDTANPYPYVTEQFFARNPPFDWLDSVCTVQERPNDPPATLWFGPEFLKQKLYQNSPVEDLELASMLTRQGSLYISEPPKEENLTADGYGLVERVFVTCGEDLCLPKEFQRWMITNYGATIDTAVIPDADHMPMFSKPDELVKCLLNAAKK